MSRIVLKDLTDANSEAAKMANLGQEIKNLSESASSFYNRCKSNAEGPDVEIVLEALEKINNWSGGLKSTSSIIENLANSATSANNTIIDAWPIADAIGLSNKDIETLEKNIKNIESEIDRLQVIIDDYKGIKNIIKKIKFWQNYKNALDDKEEYEAQLEIIIEKKNKIQSFFEKIDITYSEFDSNTSDVVISIK